MTRPQLLDLSLDELRDQLARIGEPRFRAEQLWQAVFRDLTRSYTSMTTLPKSLRQRLVAQLPWHPPELLHVQESQDGETSKLLLKLEDGQTIEAVIMRYPRRVTACLSTQIGCRIGCAFCATGRSGFVRDLSASEIVEQVLTICRLLESDRLSRIVLMGMGEPLDNYRESIRAIRILNDPQGLGLGARCFTISTVGLVPGILRLAEEPLQLTLAVSLHTVDNATRNRLVPINHRYPVEDVLRACRTYSDKTHRRVTYEVALIAGVNDREDDAEHLARALHGTLCHVNLIPLNPHAGYGGQPPNPSRVSDFSQIIESRGISVTVRQRRGVDIRAGCGQLRVRSEAPDASSR